MNLFYVTINTGTTTKGRNIFRPSKILINECIIFFRWHWNKCKICTPHNTQSMLISTFNTFHLWALKSRFICIQWAFIQIKNVLNKILRYGDSPKKAIESEWSEMSVQIMQFHCFQMISYPSIYLLCYDSQPVKVKSFWLSLCFVLLSSRHSSSSYALPGPMAGPLDNNVTSLSFHYRRVIV